ncbi:MAG: DUF2461 family protein, partial [Hyphomicrobiales bacterium]|nr:DUF2461 family protein [Hyphomicrobiales bacterium]
MTAALGGAGLKLREDTAMKRAPRGFEDVADPMIAAALRNKSFVCSRPVPSERIATPALVDDICAFAGEAKPLLEWGWSAVVDVRQ